MSRADTLHITDGVVWVIGHSDEELALLDPLPAGVEVLHHRDEDEPEEVTAALVVVDDVITAPGVLDESLPRVGSIPLVWLVVPREARGLQAGEIESLAADYGWNPIERAELDDSWLAVRIEQD